MTSVGQNRQGRCRETSGELQRRALVERREKFLDRSEQFEEERRSAPTDAEREALVEQFVAERRAYREAEEAEGRRSSGIGVIGKQVMWAAWSKIAVHHAVLAREAIAPGPSSEALGAEFHASLVAITASAYTVEAVYGELKYLVPSQKCDSQGNGLQQFQIVRNTFAVAFGLKHADTQRLSGSLSALFRRRNFAVHPYAEQAPLVPHTSGVLSSPELAEFNAETSKQAATCALDVLDVAAQPPRVCNRWVERWVDLYAQSLRQTVASLRPDI